MQILHLFFFILLASMPALQAGKGGNAKPAGKAGMNPMMGMMMGGGGGGATAVQNTATGIDGISSSGKNLNATQVDSMGSIAGSSGLNTSANSDGPQLAANTDFGDEPADDGNSAPDAGAYPDDMGIDEGAEADITDDAGSAYLQDDAGDAGEDDQQDAPPADQQSNGLVANNQTSLDDLIHQQRMLNDQSEQELADDAIFDDSDDEQDDQGDDEE